MSEVERLLTLYGQYLDRESERRARELAEYKVAQQPGIKRRIELIRQMVNVEVVRLLDERMGEPELGVHGTLVVPIHLAPGPDFLFVEHDGSSNPKLVVFRPRIMLDDREDIKIPLPTTELKTAEFVAKALDERSFHLREDLDLFRHSIRKAKTSKSLQSSLSYYTERWPNILEEIRPEFEAKMKRLQKLEGK